MLRVFFAFFAFCLIWMLSSSKPDKEIKITGQQRQIDERDIIFSRFDLEKNSHLYHQYYQSKKDLQKSDDQIRNKPDILSPFHMTRDPINFSLADSEFDFLEHQLERKKSPVARKKSDFSKSQYTEMIKNILRYLGADLCGVCELDQSYVYSHVGRGPDAYGTPIQCSHKYAVVFAVKMDFEIISMAPKAPVIVETAHKYIQAAQISIITANFIRKLGYASRAHFAGSDYKAMLPPLAYKAGLGEIGRLGILITKSFGPRVRLGLVTTDLPLIPDTPNIFGVQNFCHLCKKCADNCPSQAIPFGDKQEENGSQRWVINREACYDFWRQCGTDCARCISVCPYSKPDNFIHNLIRKAISMSQVVQNLSVKADDFFYGIHPKGKQPLDWTKHDLF
ncbi:MAG: reductive dehalogenase [Candidatus Aminicenantes bacterium]|nr:reductive dehalogenase [Candidatus Aminicenantes bacterium]